MVASDGVKFTQSLLEVCRLFLRLLRRAATRMDGHMMVQ
jgi:hypothetical protein